MKFIWITFVFTFIVYALLSNFGINPELLATTIVLLHSVVVLISLFKIKGLLGLIISLGFIIRVLTMLWDIYMRHIFSLPHSGADTEAFLRRAISISSTLTTILQSSYEMFIRLLAFVIHFTTQERIFLQYINVLLGISSVYLVYKLLVLLKVKTKNVKLGTFIASFLPHAIIFSSILLREMPSAFFVTLSSYYLIKWFHFYHRKYFIYSIVAVLISSLFHSGVFFFLFAHAFIIVFYNKKYLKYVITSKALLLFIIVGLSSIGFFTLYDWQSLAVFRKLRITGIEDIYGVIDSSRGASAYLTNVSINNFFQLILYLPVFFVYFILSPMPYNWRSLNDIMAFMLDGLLITMFLGYASFKLRRIKSNKKVIIIALMIGVLAAIATFAIGVQNAGTALRHRNKILYPLIILFVLTKDLIERRDLNEL